MIFLLSFSLKHDSNAKLHLTTTHLYLGQEGVGVGEGEGGGETLVGKFEGDQSELALSFIQLLKDAT